MAEETPKKTTDELIAEALLQPSSVSGDGVSVSNRSAADLIAIDNHLQKKAASASRNAASGLRFSVFRGAGHF